MYHPAAASLSPLVDDFVGNVDWYNDQHSSWKPENNESSNADGFLPDCSSHQCSVVGMNFTDKILQFLHVSSRALWERVGPLVATGDPDLRLAIWFANPPCAEAYRHWAVA